jgi:hypothetical protein
MDFSFLSFVVFLAATGALLVFTFRTVLFVFFEVLPTINNVKGAFTISGILTVWILWSVCQIPGVATFYVEFFRYMPGTRPPLHNPMLDRDAPAQKWRGGAPTG